MAIQDALATFPADRIVIFAREGDSARYREENLFDDVQERFGVPVVECRTTRRAEVLAHGLDRLRERLVHVVLRAPAQLLAGPGACP